MTDDENIDRARRKLLRALVYAAPLVLSSVVIKPAHAQVASCGPMSCNPVPCAPLGCPPIR
jgi:hypothetical protein